MNQINLFNQKSLDHVAIMKKQWHLVDGILKGNKIAESRWFNIKARPWNTIKKGDVLYFKETGDPVHVKAKVTKVLRFENLTKTKTLKLIKKYGKSDLGIQKLSPDIKNYIMGKKYGLIIYFDQVKQIKPFNIDKTGFGTMAAWITVDAINKINKDW